MRFIVILIFACVFILFVATAAQASEFTDNTCYVADANCQTNLDWTRGWCEAAIAQDWIVGSVDECVIGEAITLTPEQRQARIQARIARQNQAQNQNTERNASLSKQSSGGGQDSPVRASGDSGHGSAHSESNRLYRVMRTDPTQFVWVRQIPPPVPDHDRGIPNEPVGIRVEEISGLLPFRLNE